MSRANYKYYVFVLEKRIDIPTTTALYKDQLPNFFKDSTDGIRIFLDNSTSHDPVTSDSDLYSPNVSPRKKQKTKASH